MKTASVKKTIIGLVATLFFSVLALLSVTGAAPENPPSSNSTPSNPSTSPGPRPYPSEDSNADKAKNRLREGTVLESESGFFQLDGDGAIFVTDAGILLNGLPNLNLERVVRTLKGAEEATQVHWSVSGIVTEFGAQNFVLIRRAVYKSVTKPPTPEQILE